MKDFCLISLKEWRVDFFRGMKTNIVDETMKINIFEISNKGCSGKT